MDMSRYRRRRIRRVRNRTLDNIHSERGPKLASVWLTFAIETVFIEVFVGKLVLPSGTPV